MKLTYRHAWYAFAVYMGAALGVSIYTFVYAKGYSYLTNDPRACLNCHVMKEQYDGWVNSSHRNVASCNDCHTPHNLVGKLATKASSGFWHSYYFTTQTYAEPIRITAGSRRIALNTCRSCHAAVTDAIDGVHKGAGKLDCLHCHQNVGH